jgi:endonuclease IV
MEFWLETPHFWLRDLPVNEVIACRNEHPEISSLTVHSPILDLNPCSINPDVAQVSVEHAVRSIAIAEQMGAHILTVHPGRGRQSARPVQRILHGSITMFPPSVRQRPGIQ